MKPSAKKSNREEIWSPRFLKKFDGRVRGRTRSADLKADLMDGK